MFIYRGNPVTSQISFIFFPRDPHVNNSMSCMFKTIVLPKQWQLSHTWLKLFFSGQEGMYMWRQNSTCKGRFHFEIGIPDGSSHDLSWVVACSTVESRFSSHPRERNGNWFELLCQGSKNVLRILNRVVFRKIEGRKVEIPLTELILWGSRLTQFFWTENIALRK